jgi:hypothetical protein
MTIHYLVDVPNFMVQTEEHYTYANRSPSSLLTECQKVVPLVRLYGDAQDQQCNVFVKPTCPLKRGGRNNL